MQPTANQVHVDALLTNISIGYRNGSYIADRLFPIVPVNKQSNIIPNYEQSHWFRNDALRRSSGTKSQGGGFKVNSTNTYFCDRFSYRKEIEDELRDNADAPYNLDADATRFVTDKLMMSREVAFATDFFTTGVWGADKVGGTDFIKWDDFGGSSPLLDVTKYKDAIEAKIAVEANNMVIGKEVWVQAKWHPDLIDNIKYTQRGQLSTELVASLFEVDNLFVGRSIYTASAEGTAEASVTYSRIWGKHALLMYTPKGPSLLEPAAGYTFVWQRVAAALQYIKRMRDEEREVDIVEANSYFDQKVTGAAAGLFMQNVVT